MAFQTQALFEDAVATGNLSALNDTIVMILNNSSGAIVNISGNWIGTVLFEGSNDGFVTMQSAAVFTPSAGVISAGVSSNGYYRFIAVSGFTQIRARMSSYTSGTAVVVLSASIGAGLAPTVSINYDSNLGTSKLTGSTDGTKIGNNGDRLKVDTTLTGTIVPTITNKLRIRTSTAIIALPSTNAYQTIYTRSGTGLFFGFQLKFNNANANVRFTVDDGEIFTLSLDIIKQFEFNDTGNTRMQMGAFLSTSGNVFDFSSRFAIPYTTSILIEAASADGSSHSSLGYVVIHTEDT